MKILLFSLILFSISCTRTPKAELSTLKFNFSKIHQKGSGLLPLSLFPTDTDVCYGVNITGADLPSTKHTCGPTLGLAAGFVSPNSELSIEVPFGSNREVELYAYLPTSSESCATLTQTNLDPSATYLVGKLSDVTFDQLEVILPIPISFPGVAHSIFADLNMDESCLSTSTPPITEPPTNPNAPVILKSQLNMTSITTSGVDETIILDLLVQAVYLPNWLNLTHDGPNGNITGGGAGHTFIQCTLANVADSAHICFDETIENYYATQSFTISQWAPNGTYSFQMSVQDSMFLTSEIYIGPTYTITNHVAATAPTITSISMVPDAGLTAGLGGNVLVKILVQSTAPPNFLEKNLSRPDTSMIYGGGSGVTFDNCSPYTGSAGHICDTMTSDHWFYSFTDTINPYQQNGTYSYSGIRVQNSAMLNSNYYASSLNFTVSGNTAASVPTILGQDVFYAFDDSPFSNGITYFNTSCVRPEGSALQLGIDLKVNSNVDINWINYMMNGPSGVIAGGGSGITGTYFGSDIYQVEYELSVPAVTGAPRGNYVWNNVNVKNLGDLQSSSVSGLTFNLQDSCMTNYNSISSSANSTCGVTSSGNIRCWGQNNYNQIGYGSTSNRKYPTVVAGDSQFSMVSSGSSHTCAIATNNKLFCWGSNPYSQIGDGTTTPASKPVAVDVAENYISIAAGLTHTCGVTSANVLKCWGRNTNGQLGDGSTITRSTPVTIDAGTFYISVSTGYSHTCGITTSNALKCWGQNIYGQLGIGSTTQTPTPAIVDSGVYYYQVDTGGTDTCGITTSGSLKCWGYNVRGQVGDGTITQRTSPVDVNFGTPYAQVSVGGSHTCGITTANVLKCWGKNVNGQLGNNTMTDATTPIVINTGTSYNSITTGATHTCAVTQSAQPQCWGDNIYNQIGDSTTTQSLVPVLIDQ